MHFVSFFLTSVAAASVPLYFQRSSTLTNLDDDVLGGSASPFFWLAPAVTIAQHERRPSWARSFPIISFLLLSAATTAAAAAAVPATPQFVCEGNLKKTMTQLESKERKMLVLDWVVVTSARHKYAHTHRQTHGPRVSQG